MTHSFPKIGIGFAELVPMLTMRFVSIWIVFASLIESSAFVDSILNIHRGGSFEQMIPANTSRIIAAVQNLLLRPYSISQKPSYAMSGYGPSFVFDATIRSSKRCLPNPARAFSNIDIVPESLYKWLGFKCHDDKHTTNDDNIKTLAEEANA